MDVRRKFFSQRVVRHWNRLPKEAVDAPSLQASKARLDVALGSLVCWLATCTQQGVGTRLSLSPLQPRPCYDSTWPWSWVGSSGWFCWCRRLEQMASRGFSNLICTVNLKGRLEKYKEEEPEVL